MPQLWKNEAPCGVHFFADAPPSGECILTVESRDPRSESGGRMRDPRAFGHDQPNATFRTAAVIRSHVRAWDAVWRRGASHRRHDDAVREPQTVDADGSKEGLGRAMHQMRASMTRRPRLRHPSVGSRDAARGEL